MKPIVTITLNPAVDLTIEVSGLVQGGVNRAEQPSPMPVARVSMWPPAPPTGAGRSP